LQPRKDFSPEALRELADSIKEQGIVQPLIVRERNGHLELIAGERRWRAAGLAVPSEATSLSEALQALPPAGPGLAEPNFPVPGFGLELPNRGIGR